VSAVRRALAGGAVTGLSVKTAATLLRTIELPTWHRFAALVAVLALRVFLKRVFAGELGRSAPPAAAGRTGGPPVDPDGRATAAGD